MTSSLFKSRTAVFAVFVNNLKLRTFLNTTLNFILNLCLKNIFIALE